MAFVRRKLTATFQLAGKGPQTFAGTKSDTVTLEGLRMIAKITNAGTPSFAQLDLTVYGMKKSTMNSLSTLGVQINLQGTNRVVLQAGDDESGMGSVFAGTILAAYADFQNQPEVPMRITAQSGLAEAVLPADASSYKGPTDVATVMSDIATKMGLVFENNGVQTKLSFPYFPGSLRSQAEACAKAAGIQWTIENGKLAIWPRNGSRGGTKILLSPQTGLVGYPTYTAYGLVLRSIFNRSIALGSVVQVKSDLQPANGDWTVYNLNHDLASEVPGGPWFSDVLAYNPKLPNQSVAPVLSNG